MPSLLEAWAVDLESWLEESQYGRLPESNCRPQHTRHKCRRGDNRWAKRSVWLQRPGTYGRTNSAESHPFPTCFSLGFTPWRFPGMIPIQLRSTRAACRLGSDLKCEGRSYRFCRLVDD